MVRSWRSLFTVVLTTFAVTLCLQLAPRVARADEASAHTVPVAVLALDTESVDENADALTTALRSQVRAAHGWSLQDSSQALSLLTAALKCPSHPNLDCQQKISEHLKAERYIWGFVTKGPSSGEVTAEVHLYQKGKADTATRESFAANLTDASDDGLRAIAKKIVERLGGIALGVILVDAGDADGEVIVDGDKRFPLRDGQARVEVAEGSHSIEVDAPSISPTKRNVLVTAGKETNLDVRDHLIEPPPAAGSKPFPTRAVVGGVSIGVGVVLGALAVQQGLLWSELQDRGDSLKHIVPAGQRPCDPNGNAELCTIQNRSVTSSAIAIASGAVGAVAIGAGAYLLLTGGDASDEAKTTGKRTRIMPMVSTSTGGLMMSGAF